METETPEGLLSILLGAVRALSWDYQTSHWQASGESSYGDHLLFQRMYEALGVEIDGLAEKIVGYYGISPVESSSQVRWTTYFLSSWSKHTCPFLRGMQAEETLQKLYKKVYDKLEETGSLSLGMDDFLMAAASAHETNIYLLGRRISEDAHNG